MAEESGLRAGVIGLGVMGASMARHLLAAGIAVAGFDVADGARRAAEADGVRLAPCSAQLAGEAELLVTSLPSAQALEQVTEELVGAPAAPRFLLETSTLSLADKEACRARLSSRGIEVLDCPISGTGGQMARGDAVLYASGEARAYEQVRPVLSVLGRAVHYVGSFGNGTKLKFAANLLVAVHNVAAAEALALVQRCALPLPDALVALLDGAGASTMLEVRGPAMLERRYLPAAMRVELFDKDLHLIAAELSELGLAAPLFERSLGVYEAALAAGLGAADTAAVFEVLLPPGNADPRGIDATGEPGVRQQGEGDD